MALVESLNIELGSQMPDFKLNDPFANRVSVSDVMGSKGLIVAFTCNHCPYAIAIWDRLIELAKDVKVMGINTVAINPNIHPSYPDDSPENMAIMIKNKGIPFPYLIDETQTVAKAYKAQCTPDLYLISYDRLLIYHGRLDDNWRDPHAVEERDLRNAAIAFAENRPVSQIQHASMGCSIKWVSEP